MTSATGRVKMEDAEEQDAPNEGPAIDEEDLQLLGARHAVRAQYPPGCPVLHTFAHPSPRRMEARSDVVEAVYVNLGATSTTSNRVYKLTGRTGFVLQEDLAYAMGCPVSVRGMDEGDPTKELEGTVVCPRPGRGGRTLSYSVQIPLEGDFVRVELGVEADMISYRMKVETAHEDPAKRRAQEAVLNESSNALIASAKSQERISEKMYAYAEDETTLSAGTKADAHTQQNSAKTSDQQQHASEGWKQPSTTTRVVPGGDKKESPSFLGAKHHSSIPRPTGSQGVYSRLTVPTWVTDSTDINFFLRKIPEIETETGCAIRRTSPADQVNKEPMRINIAQMHEKTRFDMMKARERIEDSLSACIQCGGGKARLRYEMALTHEGASILFHPVGAMVQQRCHASNEIVWMKLVEMPVEERGNSLLLNDSLQRRVHQTTPCSVDVFGQGLNMSLPAQLCPPFALIYGKTKENVEKASKVVENAVGQYQQQVRNIDQVHPSCFQPASLSNALVTSRKRTPPTDYSSLSSNSQDADFMARPQKSAKVASNEATCILTVPLWVSKNCTGNLFRELIYGYSLLSGSMNSLLKGSCPAKDHLIGRGGQNTKAIRSKTNCTCNLSKGQPMTISITSVADPPSFRDVAVAKRMIVESLLEFLGDSNSEGRLVYELAMTAKGTYDFLQKDGVVHQECQLTNRMIWMKLVELPSAESDGELVPHGRFLIGGAMQQMLVGDTGCYVEAYCFKESSPSLSGPYVLVCGDTPHEVKETADRVSDEVDSHVKGCRLQCRFY